VEERGVELLFGLASIPGTDVPALAQPLSCLHHEHVAPENLRPLSRTPVAMDVLRPEQTCRRDAMLAMPAIVKAYLRLGGRVGEGAFLDRDFGCVDVCMVLDTATLSDRARRFYAGDGR
jgi:putative hemolysin